MAAGFKADEIESLTTEAAELTKELAELRIGGAEYVEDDEIVGLVKEEVALFAIVLK